MNQSSSRIRILYVLIVLAALILVAQLYFVQVVHGDSYREEATDQYTSTAPIFNRGNIYFTDKDGSSLGAGAAILKTGYILAITPKDISNPEDVYTKIAPYASDIDKEKFIDSANKKSDPYEQVADHISEDDAKKIEALNIPGVALYEEHWRFYPRGDVAAHTLGFVGYKGDVLGGRYGLEQYYNDVLSEKDPTDINFFAQVFAGGGDNALSKDDDQGTGDVYTTIEPTVQNYLETTMQGALEKWQAEAAGGIIMDPSTGAVYAMAGLPTYDPNNYSSADLSTFVDPSTQKVFEMGSIVKALTMAAGIDSGAVTPSTTYDDKGTITIDGSKISNWDFKARGVINMQDVLNQSLNLGAVFVQEQMGIDTFNKYMRAYGLGDKTGIDLPNEASGLIDNLNSPREVEHATASFGQGIAMTPIETIRALASLANNGLLPNPHLVREIDYQSGPPWKYEPKPETRVLKTSTADTITNMLVGVFDHEMAGKTNPLAHYSIATKTGTAQIPDPSGGYYENRYMDTWFGYFPAYHPKFVVFLYLKHPIGAIYSSQTLVDPFTNITQFLLNYYEVPPDR